MATLRQLAALKQYLDKSPEQLAEIAAKSRPRRPRVDRAASPDLAASLPESQRGPFRREVKKVLRQQGLDRALHHQLVEEYVFLGLRARKLLIAGASGYQNAKALDLLLNRRQALAEQLGITPKERRLSGTKSESLVSEILQRSIESAARARAQSRDPERQRLIAQFEEKSVAIVARSARDRERADPDAGLPENDEE